MAIMRSQLQIERGKFYPPLGFESLELKVNDSHITSNSTILQMLLKNWCVSLVKRPVDTKNVIRHCLLAGQASR